MPKNFGQSMAGNAGQGQWQGYGSGAGVGNWPPGQGNPQGGGPFGGQGMEDRMAAFRANPPQWFQNLQQQIPNIGQGGVLNKLGVSLPSSSPWGAAGVQENGALLQGSPVPQGITQGLPSPGFSQLLSQVQALNPNGQGSSPTMPTQPSMSQILQQLMRFRSPEA